jgi:hypothetical protein
MKINKRNTVQPELTETKFIRDTKFKDHIDKHVAKDWNTYYFERNFELLPPMSEDEYDESADILSKKPVRTSNIDSEDRYVGFVCKSGKIIKYDKLLRDLVIYVCNPSVARTVTYYQCNSLQHNRYKRLFEREYAREITPEDDKYNN